jgi:hypothetical protein
MDRPHGGSPRPAGHPGPGALAGDRQGHRLRRRRGWPRRGRGRGAAAGRGLPRPGGRARQIAIALCRASVTITELVDDPTGRWRAASSRSSASDRRADDGANHGVPQERRTATARTCAPAAPRHSKPRDCGTRHRERPERRTRASASAAETLAAETHRRIANSRVDGGAAGIPKTLRDARQFCLPALCASDASLLDSRRDPRRGRLGSTTKAKEVGLAREADT